MRSQNTTWKDFISPNLNAFAERWVRSVKEECLSKLILFGESSLRRALTEFIDSIPGYGARCVSIPSAILENDPTGPRFRTSLKA
jgi:hypothetical protein